MQSIVGQVRYNNAHTQSLHLDVRALQQRVIDDQRVLLDNSIAVTALKQIAIKPIENQQPTQATDTASKDRLHSSTTALEVRVDEIAAQLEDFIARDTREKQVLLETVVRLGSFLPQPHPRTLEAVVLSAVSHTDQTGKYSRVSSMYSVLIGLTSNRSFRILLFSSHVAIF